MYKGAAVAQSSLMDWRAKPVADMLHVCDLLHFSSKLSPDMRVIKPPLPRVRIVGQAVQQDSRPVSDLPRNFYDPDWLADQDSAVINNLHIRAPVPLHITKELRECVIECISHRVILTQSIQFYK